MSTQTSTISSPETQKSSATPPLFNVIFYNDDDTPMEFVIQILIQLFEYNPEAAIDKTQEIHESSFSCVAQYDEALANLKHQQVQELNQIYGFSLATAVVPDDLSSSLQFKFKL